MVPPDVSVLLHQGVLGSDSGSGCLRVAAGAMELGVVEA
jgi:hypothetical protein